MHKKTLLMGLMFALLFASTPTFASTKSITLAGQIVSISQGTSPATIILRVKKQDYRISITKKTQVVSSINPIPAFSNAAAAFEMLSTDDTVTVVATRQGSIYTAGTIRITNVWDGPKILQKGIIQSVRCSSSIRGTLSVRINGVNRKVSVQRGTIMRRSGVRVDCADMQTGENATLLGAYASSGVFAAERILLPDTIVSGTIRSIKNVSNGISITLRLADKRTVSVVTSPATQYQATNLSVGNSGMLEVNDQVVVRGVKLSKNRYLAAMIRDTSVRTLTTGHIVGKLALEKTMKSSSVSPNGFVRASSITVTGSAVISGWGDALDADNRYAYVVGTTGLQIVDIQNPAQPVIVGKYSNGKHMTTVKVSGDYAYVHDESGLSVIDVSTPTDPTLRGFVANELYNQEAVPDANGKLSKIIKYPHPPRYMEMRGNVVAVAGPTSARPEQLALFDVSDPANPVLASAVNISKYFAPFAINGSYLYTYAGGYDRDYNYVDNGHEGLWIYDISDVHNPKLISTDTSLLDGYEIMPVTRFDGPYAYTRGHDDIRSFSVSNGTVFARLDLLEQQVSNMTVHGQRLYALTYAYYSQPPWVLDIDISDPLHLRLLGAFSDPSFLVARDSNDEGGAAIEGIAANDNGIILLRPADLPPALNGEVRTSAMLITMKFGE